MDEVLALRIVIFRVNCMRHFSMHDGHVHGVPERPRIRDATVDVMNVIVLNCCIRINDQSNDQNIARQHFSL